MFINRCCHTAAVAAQWRPANGLAEISMARLLRLGSASLAYYSKYGYCYKCRENTGLASAMLTSIRMAGGLKAS